MRCGPGVGGWVMIAALAVVAPCFGQTTPQSAHDDGKTFGGNAGTQAQGFAKSQGSVGSVPGYAGANVSETQYQSGNMQSAAVTAANDTSTESGQAASLVGTSFASRPQMTVSKSDSWLQPGDQAIANPQGIPGISGQYGGCQNVPGPGYTTPDIRTCDVYYTESSNQCASGVNVNVQANYAYACTETRTSYTRTCTRTLSATYNATTGSIDTTWTPSCP